MKKFALGLVIVLASTAFAFAAAKTGDSSVDSQGDKVTNAAAGQNVKAKTKAHAANAKGGDIIIKGKAGTVPNVDVGQNVKTETSVGSVKVGGK